ncbi:ATP-binding cassette domain-containing protein [Steroidobacter flavus]|uniref:ATP-binding cassette domain-containing protein n=1 Tax=Steroidobacter flavus TaxID=1842136 RepID=A0ABV8SYR3_9GAMM
MAAAVLLIAVAAALFGSTSMQRVVAHAAVMLSAVLALQLFSGNSRIVSFGHAAFMALGAYTVGILTLNAQLQHNALPQLPTLLADLELSTWNALIVAALVGAIAGVISGATLLRLSGSAAAIATLAFLIIVYTLLAAAREITRGSQPFYGVPRDAGLWATALFAMLTLVITRTFRETSWGLAARAAADDEAGAIAVGINPRAAFFFPWVLSATLAAVAGGLLAQVLGAFTPHTFYFDLAFTLLVTLIVGGMGSSLGALAGLLATTVLIEVMRQVESAVSVFGLTQSALAIAMILVIWRRPEGLSGGLELNLLRRLGKQPAAPVVPMEVKRANADVLRVAAVTKRYAGLVAVSDVSFEIAPDSITGIIGPNGAGKTTLVSMLAGHVPPTDGKIHLGETAVHKTAAHRVVRAGLGRTFQNIRVFTRMTVLENVLSAARGVHSNVAAAEEAARRELARVGLLEQADALAGSLAYGMRRRVEIARALACEPTFLLLDEPAAGLNPAETRELMILLAAVRKERGIGIVLVEHDLMFVMQLCESILVLDQGRLIADGTPAEVQSHPAVIAAYLGSRVAAKSLATNQPSLNPVAAGSN